MTNIVNNSLNVNNVTSFNFNNMDVRVIDKGNDPWFVLVDVCKILEINNSRQASSYLDSDERGTVTINDGTDGNPQKTVINESGLYSLILRSRKPEAKRFKKWVTAEVLPSIRKTGGYMATIPNETPEQTLSRGLLIAKDTIDRQAQEISELKPKADALDLIASHEGLYCLRVGAKNLDMKPMALIDYLSRHLWIHKNQGKGNWIAYQDKINAGYLKHKSTYVHNSDGELVEKSQTLITPKGLAKLAEIFSKEPA